MINIMFKVNVVQPTFAPLFCSFFNVFLKRINLLSLKIVTIDSTDKTFLFDVLNQLFSCISQLTKCINDNTKDDINKENIDNNEET